MNPCSSSFHSNNPTHNNRLDTVEELRWYRSCPRHRGNPLISLCLFCEDHSEVFHCKICEEECPHGHQQTHVSLSHLNYDVEQETVIPNWPVLRQQVFSRIQSALSSSFAFQGEIEQIDNKNEMTFSSLKQLQLRLQDIYNQFSQQKQFRDILSKDFLDHQQMSMQLIRVINFTKQHQKAIEEEFLTLLDNFEILKNNFGQTHTNHTLNCIEQKLNKLDLESHLNGDSGQKINNNTLQIHNQQIQSNISELNKMQTYENNTNDGKQIESIFYEISRMPELNSLKLDLSKQMIDPERAKQLADSFGHLINLIHLELNLPFNSIGLEGVKSLASSLTILSNLIYLNLNLELNYEELTESDQICSEGAKVLADSLSHLQNLTNLSLNLYENNIDSEGAKSFADSLACLLSLTNLNLNLNCNNINPEGAKSIADSFACLPNLTNLSLDLSCSNIGSDGVKSIADSLAHLPNLSYLNLDLYANTIDSEGAKSLSDSLPLLSNLTNLNLNLGDNNIGSEGAKSLADQLPCLPSFTILDLNLCENNIVSQGAKYLVDLLPRLPNLINLNLNLFWNNIGQEAEKPIVDSLAPLPNINLNQSNGFQRSPMQVSRSANRLLSSSHTFSSNSLRDSTPTQSFPVSQMSSLMNRQAPFFSRSSSSAYLSSPRPNGNQGNENVKVAIRVRPPLASEIQEGFPFLSSVDISSDKRSISIYDFLQTQKLPEEEIHALIQNPNRFPKYSFTFDAVYDQDATQAQVYEQTAKQSVQSVLEGFNSTIFAYGQTGTGKTHTMEGFTLDPNSEEVGIIPRAMKEIFEYIQNSKDAKFMVRCSYLQIYNEYISDLLRKNQVSLQIREDKRRGVYVEDLTEWAVRSPNDVFKLIAKGKSSRATASTKMNDMSSRSHAVFIVTVEQVNSSSFENGVGKIKTGKLNLVDLAGSERVSITGAVGQRLEECKKINQSLSALGNVISALTDLKGPRTHIPYRDSKITRILEDSLGGNCKTTMIAMISPSADQFNHSLSTLKFSNRTKSIQNRPVVNQANEEAKELLIQYEQELRKLRTQLDDKRKAIFDINSVLRLQVQVSQAEQKKDEAILAYEQKLKELHQEKEDKKRLEEKIKAIQSQVIIGGEQIDENVEFTKRLEEKQRAIRDEYEQKIAFLENEQFLESENQSESEELKALILKQRQIMVGLSHRLKERDQRIIELEEEIDVLDQVNSQTEQRNRDLEKLFIQNNIPISDSDLQAFNQNFSVDIGDQVTYNLPRNMSGMKKRIEAFLSRRRQINDQEIKELKDIQALKEQYEYKFESLERKYQAKIDNLKKDNSSLKVLTNLTQNLQERFIRLSQINTSQSAYLNTLQAGSLEIKEKVDMIVAFFSGGECIGQQKTVKTMKEAAHELVQLQISASKQSDVLKECLDQTEISAAVDQATQFDSTASPRVIPIAEFPDNDQMYLTNDSFSDITPRLANNIGNSNSQQKQNSFGQVAAVTARPASGTMISSNFTFKPKLRTNSAHSNLEIPNGLPKNREENTHILNNNNNNNNNNNQIIKKSNDQQFLMSASKMTQSLSQYQRKALEDTPKLPFSHQQLENQKQIEESSTANPVTNLLYTSRSSISSTNSSKVLHQDLLLCLKNSSKESQQYSKTSSPNSNSRNFFGSPQSSTKSKLEVDELKKRKAAMRQIDMLLKDKQNVQLISQNQSNQTPLTQAILTSLQYPQEQVLLQQSQQQLINLD